MEAAIFDIDGTIIDSLYIWDILAYEYLKSLGYSPDKNIAKEVASMNLDESSLYMKEKFRIDKTSQEIKTEIEDLLSYYYKEKFQAKNGVVDYIKYLYSRKVGLYIGTTISLKLGGLILERLGIAKYFKEIFTEEGLGISKRQAGFYNKIIEKIGINRDRTYVFEDSYYAVKSAKKSGLKVVLIKDDYNEKYFKKMENLIELGIRDFTEMEIYK